MAAEGLRTRWATTERHRAMIQEDALEFHDRLQVQLRIQLALREQVDEQQRIIAQARNDLDLATTATRNGNMDAAERLRRQARTILNEAFSSDGEMEEETEEEEEENDTSCQRCGQRGGWGSYFNLRQAVHCPTMQKDVSLVCSSCHEALGRPEVDSFF